MAHKQPSRVRERSTTTGTGTYTLGGAALGCRTFASALSNGDTVEYVAVMGANFEIGRGTYSAGTLARTTVLRSTNADAAVDWPSGTKDIVVVPVGLSDLDATGLANLLTLMGLGAADQPVFAAVNIGATDTTVARVAAGRVSVEGVELARLGAAGTFTASQTISGGASSGLNLTATDDGAAGVVIAATHVSATPAVNDIALFITVNGKDSGGNDHIYGRILGRILDPTNGSEDGGWVFQTSQAGTANAIVGTFGVGFFMSGATGGDKGTGTINAVAVYDDNVLLTDIVDEYMRTGEVDVDAWDKTVPSVIVPARVEEIPVTEDVEVTRRVLILDASKQPVTNEVGGRLSRLETRIEKRQIQDYIPVYDEDGVTGVDMIERPAVEERHIPERVTPRRHEMAHRFKAMLAEGFDPRDPRNYIARMKADRTIPGLPTQHDGPMGQWEHGRFSIGEMSSRHRLATECLALAFASLVAEVDELAERVRALEAR